MRVLMSHMRWYFKITTCFGQEKSWEPPKCILAVFSGIAPITSSNSCSRTRVFQLDGRVFNLLLYFKTVTAYSTTYLQITYTVTYTYLYNYTDNTFPVNQPWGALNY